MLPVLTVGGVQIQCYVFFLAVALLLGCILASDLLSELYSRWKCILVVVTLVCCAAVVGKLFYIAFNGALGSWIHAYVLDGAILGCMLALLPLHKRSQAQDAVAPAIAMSMAVGRIGCLFQGCCYGIPVGRISVPIVQSLCYNQGLYRFPVPFLSMLLCLLLMVLLLFYRERCQREGAVFGLFLLCYCVGRFFLEFLRGDARILFCGLSTAQWFCVALFPYAFAKLLYGTFDRKRQNTNKIDSIDCTGEVDNA